MVFGRSYWKTIEHGMEREWLITNGIGGFASSTVCGMNSRRYHGLLVASLRPPVERHLVLSKVDESVFIGEEAYNIYTYKTAGGSMDGCRFQEYFSAFPVPEFRYRIKDMLIKKKICMVQGENTTVITYEVFNGQKKALFRMTPLVNFRNYHHCSRRAGMVFSTEVESGIVKITPYDLPFSITLRCSAGSFVRTRDNWFMDMDYPVERERGLDHLEDHYIPGYFDVELEPGRTTRIAIKASIEDTPDGREGFLLAGMGEERVIALKKKLPFGNGLGLCLGISADSFIVRRKSTASKTILAGYPWFTDWGRDAMISLPGLTLATGRFDDARDILHTFCRFIDKGLAPNLFPDEGQEPAYNSADASLWFFEAAGRYLEYTTDARFLREELLPAMKSIFGAYRKGTMFNIHMDKDFLVSAGDINTQLTWMDAVVNGRAVTPRWGKTVEINALWFNAACVMAECLKKLGEDPEDYLRLAANIRESFLKYFVNKKTGCLNDAITSSGAVDCIRPNQVFAASLTYPVVMPAIAENILQTIWDKLYTPYGLRSLSPGSSHYKGMYKGDGAERDMAYHQGTVWPWLLAPFIKAWLQVNRFSEKSLEGAHDMLLPFADHLNDACIGFVSEIFDGDSPFYPRGCFAQAWSVAAILEIVELLMKASLLNKSCNIIY